MRFALCQLNPKIGDFSQNLNKVYRCLEIASKHKVDFIAFPELTLSGYPPLDLIERSDFRQKFFHAQENLVETIQKNIPIQWVCFGGLASNIEKFGHGIYNAVFLYENGKLVRTQCKQLLPNYDVFDELRHFDPGHAASSYFLKEEQHSRIQLILSICEDVWFEQKNMRGHFRYEKNPLIAIMEGLLRNLPAFLVNISASPFEQGGKQAKRIFLLQEITKLIQGPALYINQVGANDELIFDGRSFILNAKGELALELPACEETIGIVEWNPASQQISNPHIYSLEAKHFIIQNATQSQKDAFETTGETSRIQECLVLGIRDYFKKTGFSKAVIGLSGGIDSALVAQLAVDALGSENVTGIAMPSQYSSAHSLSDAEELAKNLNIPFRVQPIKFFHSTFSIELRSIFAPHAIQSLTDENLQSRLRALILLAFSNQNNALLLATGNKSEFAVGYCTIYGDMAGALAPIGDLYKTQVYQLAHYYNELKARPIFSHSMLTKAPSAELKPNQTDQDSLPPYEILDRILFLYIEEQKSIEEIADLGYDLTILTKVESLILRSEFKRKQSPPILKISSKAFGMGRRIPIAK